MALLLPHSALQSLVVPRHRVYKLECYRWLESGVLSVEAALLAWPLLLLINTFVSLLANEFVA